MKDRLTWIAGLALALLSSGSVWAQSELRDLHLSPKPRTDAEAARIARVVAPTTDFTKPERFERNPGGAATTRRRGDNPAAYHSRCVQPALGHVAL